MAVEDARAVPAYVSCDALLQKVFETPKFSAPLIQLPQDTRIFAATAPLFVSATPRLVGYVDPGPSDPKPIVPGDNDIWQALTTLENVTGTVMAVFALPALGLGTYVTLLTTTLATLNG